MRKRVILIGTLALMAVAMAAEPPAAVDAGAYGFAPGAGAEANAKSLQKALDGGRRTVRVAKSGVYDLDRIVYLDSDTTLECAKGVVFRKAAKYSHVLVNRAAFSGGCDSNIIVRGLEIRVNGQEASSPHDSLAPGLRGQIAFFRIRDCAVRDFKLNDMGTHQYAVQVVDFDGFTIDGFEIRGNKDGVHFNAGRNFIVRNGRLRTYDDGIALNAGDWPYCTPKMGSLENGLIERIVDEPGGHCNFARVITGCWKDWHPGVRVQRDDIVRIGKAVYFVHPMPLSYREYESKTAPTHRKGAWMSPEGISWVYLQDDGETRADIKNVVFRDIEMNCGRSFSLSWEICEWARLVHPEIDPKDYPVIDIRLERVRKTVPGPIVCGNASCTVDFRECSAVGELAAMGGAGSAGKVFPTSRSFVVCDCAVHGEGKADFILNDSHGKAEIKILSGKKPSVTGATPAKVEAVEPVGDHPFSTLRLPATPEKWAEQRTILCQHLTNAPTAGQRE